MSNPKRKEIQVFGLGDKVRERKPMRKGHVAREGGRRLPLELCWIKFDGEKGKKRERKRKEKKRKKKKRRVRSSTLSLGFTEIGSSVFVGARDKVHQRDESFA